MNARLFSEAAPNYSATTFPEPRPFQDHAHQALRDGFRAGHKNQLLMSPTGSGKCLGRDTPVLLANGAVKMVQDVVVGDRLLGPDGAARNVLSVATGREPLYRVTPKKGDAYVVNASHILSLRKTTGCDGLRLANGTVVPADADVVNINVETLLQSNATARHCLKGWRSDAVEFPTEKVDLVLDPYWLGCWLGDGHQNMPALSSPECLMVEAWRETAKRFGYEVVVIQSREGDCPSWRIVSRGRNSSGYPYNVLTMGLDVYGLRQKKHVPHDYKVASIQDRLQLIAGMIDSDGSLSVKGFDWISKYKGLAEDFAFLCRSVGLAAYIQPCKKGIKSRGFVGDYWRVSVSGDTDKVPCLDKRAGPRAQKKRHLVHGIRIEPIGAGDYFGFEIDGDHLFLLGDFTVTHNTFLGLRIAHEALAKGKRALFICDRRTLIDQTSATADSYGLSAHGVMMANHWRYDPSMPFQIASAQTLARREIPPFDVCIVDECFTGDVEVLTERGFVRFDALQEGVRCAQFDGGRISFVTPTAYINKPYSGQLVRIHSDTLCDLTMTPSHEMLMRSEAGWRKFAAGVAPLNTRWQLAAAGEAVGTDAAPLTPLERLAIALQADGSIHNRDGAAETSLSFTFAKDRKVERFLALMESGQFRFTRVATTRERQRFLVHGLPPMSKRVWEHFDIASMSSAKAREVIAEMVEWDGHKARPSCWYYSSVVKDAADFFQCVALLAGYKTNLVIQHDARKESFSDVHRLFIQIKTSMFGAQRLQREVVEHDGRVYCIRVPSGNIVVRRDGKPVVIGNCHTQLAAWVNILKGTDKPCIGLSATPFSTGLGKLFSNLVNAATMAELTASGVLVPMRVMSCTTADMKDAATSGGEWTDGAAGERGMEIVGDVVSEWVKYGENRKTIVFGSTIAHCTELCKQFNEVGVLAQLFTSETTEDERKQILAEYRKPDTLLRVLISVEALAKGFDVPDVSCVVDCRPLRKSLSTAIQMWGRGLRSSQATGKTDCLLLDHSGNIIRFADDYAEIFYNGLAALDAGEKLDKTVRKDDEAKEPKSCPSCGFKPMGKRCVSCGFEVQQAALIEVIPGAMREVVIGKTKLADNHRHLYEQVVSYTRGTGNPATAKGRAAHLFKHIVGQFPDGYSYERTHNVPITRGVMNQIKAKQIAFRAAQQGARA